MILSDRDHITKYLEGIKLIELKLILERTPFELDSREGTVDEYSLSYSNEKIHLLEPFILLYTDNITNEPLKKEDILKSNVIPIEPNSLEQIWAQIGHRINFLKERKIQFNLYNIDKNKINLLKKLPKLPYALEFDLTIDEVMKFAEKEHILYQRETFLCKASKNKAIIYC